VNPDLELFLGDQIKMNGMGVTWQVWAERNVRVLVGKPETKRLLRRPDIEGTIILQLKSAYPD
jgi:hypothetical protein